MLSTTAILRRAIPAALLAFGLAMGAAAAPPTPPGPPNPPGPPTDNTNSYQVQNLVSDGAVSANHTDGHLKNPWGIAFNPFGYVWVANNHDGTSTLYDGDGALSPPPSDGGPLVVTIPPASGSGTGSPTGIVYNGSDDFQVGTAKKPARFIFVSEDGMISGWSPEVDLHNAQPAATANANYKGVAIAGNASSSKHFRLYAADFVGKKIDVYDEAFHPVTLAAGAFKDSKIPAEFGPFNITNIEGKLFVAYAQVDAEGDEVAGKGLGYVDVYDADGNLLQRFAGKGKLNAPWGMVLAPKGFGRFSGDVLVGNFGDGTINAFNLDDGHFDGQLKGTDGKPLVIPGLWGLAFGNGILHQPTDTLFFAAGINDEDDGLYGRIDLAPQAKGPKGPN